MITKKSLSIAILTAFLYFSSAILLLNTRLLAITFASSSPITEKFLLVWYLLQSAPSVLPPLNFYLLLLTALLVGINVSIAYLLLTRMQKVTNVSLSTTSTLMGMFSVGCASCGYPMLSVFGLSGTMAILPFHGSEIYIVAIGLLLFSCYYNLKKLNSPIVCKR